MEDYPAVQEANSAGGQIQARKLDITLRQNIDQKISQAEATVKILMETKDRMEKSCILDMRIDDVQRAIRW